MTELEEFKIWLETDDQWNHFYTPGITYDGQWTLIELIVAPKRRWSETVTAIVKSEKSGQHYSYDFEQGLTEYQENYVNDLNVQPVYAHEKTIVITEWLVADK